MAINSLTFAIITSKLIVKCWKQWNIPTKFEKNRTKPGNPYYLVLFENCTKPGTVLSETVLIGDSLYNAVTSSIFIKKKYIYDFGCYDTNQKKLWLFAIDFSPAPFQNVYCKERKKKFLKKDAKYLLCVWKHYFCCRTL